MVDASLVYRLILPGTHQAEVQSLVAGWLADGYEMHAPMLWAYELTSALCKTVHFGQITAQEAERALKLGQSLGLRLVAPDDELVRSAFEWTLRLRRAAAYDSFYLALAEGLNCELWTTDRRLCNALDLPWVRFAGAPS
ncbi:type II toxin-antitoxin system VapC family toxin [Chloroflexota bacterium]